MKLNKYTCKICGKTAFVFNDDLPFIVNVDQVCRECYTAYHMWRKMTQ